MNQLRLILTALLLLMTAHTTFAEVGPADLTGEDKVRYDKFRQLFLNGTPDEFYAYAKDYEEYLRGRGHMMLYYKLMNNEGFFALRHNMIFRAMQEAEHLDAVMRKDGATKYYYLATGLMGDVFYKIHDRVRAEKYFLQAIEETGDTDPKFTMRCYHSLAEMESLKDTEKAVMLTDKAMTIAKRIDNLEYTSLSLAMMAYIYFLDDNRSKFYEYFNQYIDLKSMERPDFNHRFDNVLSVANMAFAGDYEGAQRKLKGGELHADSSLVAICVYAMERDVDKGLTAIKRRYLEMDSIMNMVQSANFDQMAMERALMRSRDEAEVNKRMVKTLAFWLMGIVVVFLFVYIMGRRRLVKKIWKQNKVLKMALAKAEESDRMKSVFIRSMTHEIRTPLNAVSGFSQLLCNPQYDLSIEEKQKMQERISDNVHQITGIVNEVLELSKSESESKEAEKTDVVACNALAHSIINEVSGRKKADVELRVQTNVPDDFVIQSNVYRLKSALMHLMDNALKFTDKGFVELEVLHEKKSDSVQFRVTDTGIGIKEEDRGRIFDAFEKLNDFKGGIGLGLPICRRLVRSLGGKLELAPDYTDGCRFVISLPVK